MNELNSSLNSSLDNILMLTRKDLTNNDDNLLAVSLAIISSGAVSGQLKSFITILEKDTTTSNSHCDTLREVCEHIDEITNDIPGFIQ